MRSIPRLGWLNGKTFQNSSGSRKNRPGMKSEHANALVENSLGRLANDEFNKRVGITAPEFAKQDIPFTPEVL
jgi:hypothetical protein